MTPDIPPVLPAVAPTVVPPAVEAPRRRGDVRSTRSFLVELAIVTVGVFIALSVESLREWRQYRTLVREAHATLAREIADNKREVDTVQEGIAARKAHLSTALRFANQMLAEKGSDITSLNLGHEVADLSSASWDSAERTGALAHMEYGDVQKYSRLYAVQDLFVEQQRRGFERVAAAFALFADGDPHRAAAADLALFRQHVLALTGELEIEQQLGRRLSELYAAALAP